MKIEWVLWSSVSQGRSIPGAPVTVAPWGNRFALFLADPGGEIYTAAGDPQTGFGPWASVSQGVSTPGGHVTAVPWRNRFAVFLADPGGGIYTAAGDPQTGFGPWASVSEGISKPGAPVAAVSWGNRIALFLADPGGGIYTAAGDPQAGFGPWASVSEGISTPGGHVTAVGWGNRIALFLADPGGGIYTAAGDPQAGFGPWANVSEGISAPGGKVTAAPWGNRFVLFLADPNGGVYTATGDPQAGFGPWGSVSEGRSTPGAPITAVWYRGQFALFLADPNGGVAFTAGNPESGWSGWTPVRDHRTVPGAQVAAVPMGTRLALFMADGTGDVYATATMPMLLRAEIKFDTHDDNKDSDTLVTVFLKNRRNNSLTPQPPTDYLSNIFDLERHQGGGDLTHGEKNPYLAYGVNLGFPGDFDDPSSHTFPLQLVSDDITVDDVELPQVDIHMLASGSDQWIFDYTVTLYFDDGPFSFTSAVDGVRGIVLDQDRRNYSGIGTENTRRTLPIPVPPKAVTKAVLSRVTLQLYTHDDNKNKDTRLGVHIANRLNGGAAQNIAIGHDLLHGEELPEGVCRELSWSAEDNTLASRSIRLADIVLPMVYITIVPNDDDRWIFDYQVTFEFIDPRDFNKKPHIFSSRTNNVILDQHNNKHAGAYQGRPFPTAAPPTAPRLTYRPVEHTGKNAKSISIPFLRRKFEEFINGRNGTGNKLPLRRLHLGSTLIPVDDPLHPPPYPLPESYYDLQSLVNGDDGQVHYVRNPTSLDQLTSWWGIGDTYLGEVNSASLNISLDAQRPAPIIVTVKFEPGAYAWTQKGIIKFDNFSVTLSLTLEKATFVDRYQKGHTVIDLLAWITELANFHETVSIDEKTHLPVHHVRGTFLHQPVDRSSSHSLLGKIRTEYLGRAIHIEFYTENRLDPEDLIKGILRDKVFEALTKADPITNRSIRDELNSAATSWLLGGIADDESNTDDNNITINDVGIQNANPELSIPEATIGATYAGPKNVFVPQMPPGWPTPGNPGTTYDFSPASLANIDHIIVLTKENRSFDHMLGYLSLPVDQGGMGRPDVDGLKGGEFNSYNGKKFPVYPLDTTLFAPGPPNGYESVHQAVNGGKMDGFVRSHAEDNSDEVAGRVMGYHTGATVPVYDALARDFAIGHRWFASHPGPTFPNRYYELTGRPNIDPRGFWEFENSSPIRPVFTPTIFDYLNGATDPITGAPVTWRYFEHSYCTLRFFERYTFDHENIVDFNDLNNGFCACARSGRLPSVSFIDPHFVDYPPGSNCDEPPSDIAAGQELVKKIVEAVVASPAWKKTMLLIVYDEHGGFYDHVPPPEGARVSDEFPISTLGVRVPVFVVSPWVTPGNVFGSHRSLTTPVPLHFDHTSILKTIARRFLNKNPPYMGARYAAASDLSVVIGTQLHEPQFLPFIPYRLQFVRSQMMLTALKQPAPDPGAVLWQFPADGTNTQDFSFENAGNGLVYIRSQSGNLYLTAQGLKSVITVKTKASAGATWKLSPTSSSQRDQRLFVISNPAYPHMVLQPANPGESDSPVMLGPASGTLGIRGAHPDAWKVSSPLLAGDGVVSH